MTAAPFRLLAVDRIDRVPDPLTADLRGAAAFVALREDRTIHQDDLLDAAVGILFIHPDGNAGAVMTPDQADALAVTLKELAAEVRATAFTTATDALRRAARDQWAHHPRRIRSVRAD